MRKADSELGSKMCGQLHNDRSAIERYPLLVLQSCLGNAADVEIRADALD